MRIRLWVRGVAAVLALAASCSALAGSATDFDFWIGRWALTWADGGTGANVIEKILDGQVVRESFTSDAKTGLTGMSVSAYDPKRDLWAQTWVDNQGGYLDFTGGRVGDDMVLAREARRDDKVFRQRMVWTDIQADSLTWLWQRSVEGGGWKTLWTIHYHRAGDK